MDILLQLSLISSRGLAVWGSSGEGDGDGNFARWSARSRANAMPVDGKRAMLLRLASLRMNWHLASF